MTDNRRATVLKLVRLGVIAIGTLAVLAAGGMWWIRASSERALEQAERAFEEEIGPLDPAAWAPSPVADELNAALLLRRGAEALEVSNEETELVDRLAATMAAEWSLSDRQVLGALIERSEAAFAWRRAAVELEGSSHNMGYEAADIDIPNLVDTLRATNLEALAAQAAALDGDCRQALDHTRVLSRESISLALEPWLFFRIISSATQRHLLEAAQVIAGLCHSPNTVDSLAAVLESLRSQLPPLRKTLAGEAVLSHYRLPVVLNRASWNDWLLGRDPMRWASSTLDFWRQLVAQAESPHEHVVSFFDQNWNKNGGSITPAQILMPNVVDAVQRAQASEAALQLAQLALAVRQAGLRQGDYAANLDDYESLAHNRAYVDERTTLTRLEDGSVALELEESSRYWTDRNSEHIKPPPFRWRLPKIDA